MHLKRKPQTASRTRLPDGPIRDVAPCPFCGESASVMSTRGSQGRDIHFVGCDNGACQACGPTAEHDSVAIRRWERRAS